MVAGGLVLVYITVSLAPFSLDLPFRAHDVTIERDGSWRFSGSALALSEPGPEWLAAAVEGERLQVILEATPRTSRQVGPAVLFAIAGGARAQNLVVGQDGGDLVISVREHRTEYRLPPSLRIEDVFSTAEPRRIDVRIDGRGLVVEVDDRLRGFTLLDPDALRRWDTTYSIGVGNSVAWDRGWSGAIDKALVRTVDGETDVLAAGLQRSWDQRWVWPERIQEAPERPWGEQLATWAGHLVLAAAIVAAVARARWFRSHGSLAAAWICTALVANALKLFIAARHPSAITAIVQITGGGLAAVLSASTGRRRKSGRRPARLAARSPSSSAREADER